MNRGTCPCQKAEEALLISEEMHQKKVTNLEAQIESLNDTGQQLSLQLADTKNLPTARTTRTQVLNYLEHSKVAVGLGSPAIKRQPSKVPIKGKPK